MQKKVTKKQALKLLKQTYGREKYIAPLCYTMPDEIWEEWADYWNKINTREKRFMTGYFTHLSSEEENSILRLLVAHQFIEETYK
jgi:hypothetical protein